MNERIRELAHKAEFINKRHNGDEWRWGYIDPELADKLEKFAELIVRECAKVAGQEQVYNERHEIPVDIEQSVLEHFGVEE